MTETDAIKLLAAEQGISECEARRRLVAAADQLAQDDDEYTVEDVLTTARDFFA